jgi:membrane protein YqaA with SNARE-associated domain
MEYYIKVFYEEAWSASLIPFASSATFSALNLFGGHNMHMLALFATAGATLGLIFNWLVGHLLLKLHLKSNLNVSHKIYDRISTIFNKYLIFLLLFSWVPLCKILLLFAGFLDAPLKFVLPLVVVGQLLYFMLQIA